MAALKFARETINTPAMKKYVSLYKVPHPHCEHLPMDSDSYLECLIVHSSMTIYHPVGTCKMGPSTDPTAVVDPKLRFAFHVRGSLIQHLQDRYFLLEFTALTD